MRKTFRDWYHFGGGKEKLSQQRKLKYHTDPVYRETVKARAAEFKRRTRQTKPFEGMSMKEAAELLDVTPWTIHSWLKQGYYPEPHRVSGRPVFTKYQVLLMRLIRDFFRQHPKRSAVLHKEDLQTVVQVVHHNWEEGE